MNSEQTKRTLRFDSDLALPKAGILREALLAALQSDAAVEVDCTQATEVDVSFIQILIAAHRMAAAQGKSLSLAGPMGGALLAALERGGLLRPAEAVSTPDDAFWNCTGSTR